MSLEAPLPRLSPKEFNTALQTARRTAIGYSHNHAGLPNRLLHMKSFQDSGMDSAFLGITQELKILRLLGATPQNTTDAYYGASIMFLLLHALGEPFLRPISSTIVNAYLSETHNYYQQAADSVSARHSDSTPEILHEIDQTIARIDYHPLTPGDIYRENPSFRSWMKKMNHEERFGATRLYGLVRRQAAADQMRHLWGE